MAYTWIQFKNAVKALMTDITIDDASGTRVVSDYVKAHAARDLSGSIDLFKSYYASYLDGRKNMLGYTITLSQADLRTAVKKLISDDSINDTTAVKAVAEYAWAQMEKDYFNNLESYKAHWANYITQRQRLLGYTITLNATDLRTEVNKLLTDVNRNQVQGYLAASYWFDAQLAKFFENDGARHQASMGQYQNLKRKLLGYSITGTISDIMVGVRKLDSEISGNDDTYVRALADYTKAMAARDLSNNLESHKANITAYYRQWRRVIGYVTALSDAAVKAKVKELITDLTASDSTAVLAVAYYVKAMIAREVNHDLQEYESYWTRYMTQKNRLLGFTITLSAAALRTEVDKLITVDADRPPISDSGAYIDQLLVQARADISSLDVFLDKTILQGKADILAITAFFTEHITTVVDDIAGMNTMLEAHITQAKTEIAGLADYVHGWIDQAKADLAGSATFIDNQIRQSVIELEEYIELYRTGQETQFQDTDLVVDGGASVGAMPAEAEIQDAFIVQDDEDVYEDDDHCARQPLSFYDWGNRYDLICGTPAPSNCMGYIAIDPQSKTFVVYPKVDAEHHISIFWNGTKLSFVDADNTPFDEGMARAVADYVQAEMARRAPTRDFKLAETYLATYKSKRTQLYLKSRSRVGLKQTALSPMETNSDCLCVEA